MRNLPAFAAILLGALPLIGASSAASAANADSGRTAYANSCASCHGVPGSPWGMSVQSLQSAIQGNRGGMGRLASLSATELQDIVAYLANPTATAVATSPSPANTPTTTPSPANADSDRVFDWAEATYPQLFNSHSLSQNSGSYYLRYYPGTDVYLATGNGQLYFYNARRPEEGTLNLGAVSAWLNQAAAPTTTGRPNDDHEGGESHNGRENDEHGHNGREDNDD